MTAAAYSRVDPALRGRTALFGAALLGATALLLISACVNAGSLLLSRGMARRTELAIKTALGADRSKLVREAVLGGVLLALTGTVGGLVAASWTASSIPALFAPEHASLLDTRLQRPVIAATLGTGRLRDSVRPRSRAPLDPWVIAGSPSQRHSRTRRPLRRRPAADALRRRPTRALDDLSDCVRAARPILRHHAGRRSLPALGPLVLASVATGDEDYRTIALARLRALSSVASVG